MCISSYFIYVEFGYIRFINEYVIFSFKSGVAVHDSIKYTLNLSIKLVYKRVVNCADTFFIIRVTYADYNI